MAKPMCRQADVTAQCYDHPVLCSIAAETREALPSGSETVAEYYSRIADDYVARTRDALLPDLWAEVETRLSAGALVADLGCGGGRDARRFGDLGIGTINIDFSARMAQLARAYSGQPSVCADILRLPLRNGSVDCAWAVASLMHVPRSSITSALAEIRRILRPGGLFVASVKHDDGEPRTDQLYVYYSTEEWRSEVQRAGFTVSAMREDREAAREITWISSVAFRR